MYRSNISTLTWKQERFHMSITIASNDTDTAILAYSETFFKDNVKILQD